MWIASGDEWSDDEWSDDEWSDVSRVFGFASGDEWSDVSRVFGKMHQRHGRWFFSALRLTP